MARTTVASDQLPARPLRRPRVQLRGIIGAFLAISGLFVATAGLAQTPVSISLGSPTPITPDLELAAAEVQYLADLDLLVFDVAVAGEAGATTPDPHGELNGAPVLGYVVPTSLAPPAVGFGDADGIVALAVTSHPDFDDTPLWDENGDGDYTNDGLVWHSHWVIVVPDERVGGGLAVLEVADTAVLPMTNPGLPIALDSPGFPVLLDGGTLRVTVPAPRVGGETDFSFDAATVYLEVHPDNPADPFLGVYDVYGVLSGDLSLPYTVSTSE